MTTEAVLLMAYGTPETAADIEPYFTHIRGGKAPSPEAVERLTKRYELVGGRTPLLDITTRVRDALQAALGGDLKVYIGMKHWHPFIADTVREMSSDGIRRVTAIVLAPHYSRMSIGGYRKYLDEANEQLDDPLQIDMVESWHLQPEFLNLIAGKVSKALESFGDAREEVVTVFSAHSLPERIRSWRDPYEEQLLDSSRAVAGRLGLRNWRFAWQSAGETGEKWIGPDICEYLETLHAEGVRNVLSVPIGFLADHLEIMYDLDYEAARKARELGITYRRTEMPNDDPQLIEVLLALVEGARRRVQSAGG
jgi:protoporphyrin/coproporphyrin ferrochelatase